MFFSRANGSKYTDRGDLASPDFTLGDFNTDNTARDLDLSGKVPKGTKQVILEFFCNAIEAGASVGFHCGGYSNWSNQLRAYNLVEPQGVRCWGIISCDANRVIQYKITDSTWSAIDLNIVGWLL